MLLQLGLIFLGTMLLTGGFAGLLGYSLGRQRQGRVFPQTLDVLVKHMHCHGPQRVLHECEDQEVNHVHHYPQAEARWEPTETDVEAACDKPSLEDVNLEVLKEADFERRVSNTSAICPQHTLEEIEAELNRRLADEVRDRFRKILEEEATKCAPMRLANGAEASACCDK